MTKFLSKKSNQNIFNYIKILQIPFFSFLFITNNLIIFTLGYSIIPSHEFLVTIFTFILLLNTLSIIPFFDKSNFNFFSEYFNHWVSIFFSFFNRLLLIFFLFVLAFLTINMIYLEFEYGTILVAKTNWEYSWVVKILLLFWIFLIILKSISSIKSLLLPFSKK